MKTEIELNKEIIKITMEIKETFPELSKYIIEMPVTIPNESTPEITINILKNYYDSLDVMLKEYIINHHTKK